jgi:hypothetical protein
MIPMFHRWTPESKRVATGQIVASERREIGGLEPRAADFPITEHAI